MTDRIILHADFNSFFASVEQQANPFLRGKKIAVCGKAAEAIGAVRGKSVAGRVDLASLPFRRSVVTTASREAKQCGVKTGMSTWEAKKVCPDLLLIPADPRKYSIITERFITILRRHCDVVEQASTDEAFADITSAAQDYFGAAFVAQKVRTEIRDECGTACTVSLGIAPNRLLAKLASESMKPSGLTIVEPHQAEDFTASRPLKDFCGIGFRTECHLREIGVSSITALRKCSLHFLQNEFGNESGLFLYQAARGLGNDAVSDASEDPKSVGNSMTYRHNLVTMSDVKKNLLALADRVGGRLRKQHLVGQEVGAYVRYGNGSGKGAHCFTKEPLDDGQTIALHALHILEPHIDLNRGVRLLGVTVYRLNANITSSSLFHKERRMHDVLQSLDQVSRRFGEGAWRRATTLNTEFFERASGWHYDHQGIS